MSGRIWPGALCVITHPSMYGKPVVALSECPIGGGSFRLPDGHPNLQAPEPDYWVCESMGAPFLAPVEGFKTRVTRYATIQGRFLRPILPPPGTDCTDDRAPCEVELVGV